MRRRDFITLLGSALADQAIPANAQEPVRVRTVGALMGFANDAEAKARTEALDISPDCRAAHLQETDCVADDAVSGELVSAPNSLLTGKLTGNFANSGPQQRFPHLINELIQSLAAKFPTQRNREFLQP
jgi:hypothetical protein